MDKIKEKADFRGALEKATVKRKAGDYIDTPTIEVEPDPNCPNCSGRGQVKKVHNNIVVKGEKYKQAMNCGCVLKRAQKKSKAQGLQSWEKYKIGIKVTVKHKAGHVKNKDNNGID